MAKGLGLIGTGLKTKEQAFRGLTKAAEEESRNEALQEQIDAQMKAAETNQASNAYGNSGASLVLQVMGAKLGVGMWTC